MSNIEETEKMLMMFVADSYSSNGTPTNKTLLALMDYVAERPKLQNLVGAGDRKKILSYRDA